MNEHSIDITECPQCDEYQITIDGETYDVHEMVNCGYLVRVVCESPDGPTFYVARDSEHAGEAVKQYYLDMIDGDPDGFVCLVGSKNLISWGMGKWANHAKTLEGWLRMIACVPEVVWGTHDGTEYEIDRVSQDIVDDLGWIPSVAYRCG